MSAKGPQTLVSKMERSEEVMVVPLRTGETRPRPALLIRHLRRFAGVLVLEVV